MRTLLPDRAPVLHLFNVEKGELETYVGNGVAAIEHIGLVDDFHQARLTNTQRVLEAQQQANEEGEGVWVDILPANLVLDILTEQARWN